jgi:hypothetical protein
MTWRAAVLTIFPEMFPGALGLSLAGKALAEGRWVLDVIDIRDFATDKHRSVDDTPAGGGAGMVMRTDIATAAIDAAARRARRANALSLRAAPLTQARVRARARLARSCSATASGASMRVLDAWHRRSFMAITFCRRRVGQVLIDARAALARWARRDNSRERASPQDCWNIRITRPRSGPHNPSAAPASQEDCRVAARTGEG